MVLQRANRKLPAVHVHWHERKREQLPVQRGTVADLSQTEIKQFKLIGSFITFFSILTSIKWLYRKVSMQFLLTFYIKKSVSIGVDCHQIAYLQACEQRCGPNPCFEGQPYRAADGRPQTCSGIIIY